MDPRPRRPVPEDRLDGELVVIGGEIVTQAMRQEKPDEDFSKGTPAEAVADAIAYLCGDDAASMNGQRVSLRGAA